MEINSEDYYELLGISRDSNIEQIKKAYRKSALRWHPDKNLDHRELAEKNFKRISEAYEVLSDTNKRQIYDRYGKEGLTSGGADVPPGGGFGFPGMADFFGGGFGPFGAGGGVFGFNFRDPNDVFREFFGSSDPFADFFSETSTHTSNGDASRSRSGHSTGGFFDPFSMFGNNMFGVGGTSMHMSTSMMGGSGGANMKRISTSVKTVNGKRVETKRVVDNGVETVTIIENGVVKSKTVNGQPQLTSG